MFKPTNYFLFLQNRIFANVSTLILTQIPLQVTFVLIPETNEMEFSSMLKRDRDLILTTKIWAYDTSAKW